MYPDLSYFFNDVFGTPVDNWISIFKSFGFMLGMAFIACYILLRKELQRLESENLIQPTRLKVENKGINWQEIGLNGLFLLVLAAKLPYIVNHFDTFKADPASVIFSGKGNWLLGILAGVAASAYYYYTAKKDLEKNSGPVEVIIHPHQRATDIIFIAAISGVAGARLFSILENLDSFFRDPIGQLFSGSGLTVYGGIILAFIAVYWYVKKHGIKPVYMMDIAGMGILLGYAIGRIGCQVSGDGDWGIVAAAQPSWWFLPDWLWSYNYPNNVNNEGVLLPACPEEAFYAARGTIEDRCAEACGMRYCHELSPRVYPTPIYETVTCLIGFALLYINRRRFKVAGTIFSIYLIFNGIERLLIEFIRVNDRYEIMGLNLSQAQYISILFIILGVAGLYYLSKKKPGWEKD
jgi:phosphatidylglycerol:prolipoprotein diacylglycerol transferase